MKFKMVVGVLRNATVLREMVDGGQCIEIDHLFDMKL